MSEQMVRDGRPLGHKVGRGDGEHLLFSGMEVLVRASAESTGGAFTVLEERDPIDVPLPGAVAVTALP